MMLVKLPGNIFDITLIESVTVQAMQQPDKTSKQ